MNTREKATRVIALEEAFLHPQLRETYPKELGERLDMIKDRLTDVGPERIRRMDAAGIDLQVLSHTAPGVQLLEEKEAIRLSKEVNDWLGEIVQTYPTRFAGFATLPTQSPQEAADELERTVTQLGFKGALINGHTHERYLDDDAYSVLFERVQALDVPLYIHPTDPPQTITDLYYQGNQALVQSWGWQVETGTHLLRLMSNGVFDRYPRLKIIVGHMGELIPFHLKRITMALTMGEWLLAAQTKASPSPTKRAMQKSVSAYMHDNVFITTSGVFDHIALDCAIAEVGIDHILFSVDDPFADNFEAVDFLTTARISKEDREKLAHGNAERILKLSTLVTARDSIHRSSVQDAMFAFRARTKANIGRVLLSFLVK